MKGARAFKELNGHCDFTKEGCMIPDGYADLQQLLLEVRNKDLKLNLAKRKIKQFEELGISLHKNEHIGRNANKENSQNHNYPFQQCPTLLEQHPASFM